MRSEHRAIHPATFPQAKHGILAPQSQEITVERDGRGVLLALRPVQLAAHEGRWMRGVENACRRIAPADAPELRHEFGPPFPNQLPEIATVIGEEVELARRPELLSLKQHRRLRRQQQK